MIDHLEHAKNLLAGFTNARGAADAQRDLQEGTLSALIAIAEELRDMNWAGLKYTQVISS